MRLIKRTAPLFNDEFSATNRHGTSSFPRHLSDYTKPHASTRAVDRRPSCSVAGGSVFLPHPRDHPTLADLKRPDPAGAFALMRERDATVVRDDA
jgi:hypothetical protein